MWGEDRLLQKGVPRTSRRVQDGPDRRTREGDSPVVRASATGGTAWQGHTRSASSAAWECSVKEGGGLLPRLNTCLRPISHKYREGKVKRTLKRESKRARNYGDGSLCPLHKCWPGRPGRYWDTVMPWGEFCASTGCGRGLGLVVPPGETRRGKGRGQPGPQGGARGTEALPPAAAAGRARYPGTWAEAPSGAPAAPHGAWD